jgi:hypothetical protein
MLFPVEGQEPITVALPGWTLHLQQGRPSLLGAYRDHATLVEDFHLADGDAGVCFAAVSRASADWPELVVVLPQPAGYGFNPGVAFVPDTAVLFIGAGTRLLAYSLEGAPARLWEDVTELGFFGWSVHPGGVLMAAELELAAWDLRAAKLWSTFVEPPWSYAVAGDRVRLDVMGRVTDFPLTGGPA